MSSSLRRRALVVALVLAVAAVGVFASMSTSLGGRASVAGPPGYRAGQLKRYDAGGWTFAAAFPSVPSIVRVPSSLDGAPYVAITYSAVSADVEMNVSVYPYPLGTPSTSVQAFLHVVTKGGRSPERQKLRPGSSTTVQGLPALRLAATSDGGNMASLGVIVLDGHVAYELVLAGPSNTIAASFRQALASFRILDPARGVVRI